MNENIFEIENLVTIKTFAKLAGTSTSYLYRLEKQGAIFFIDIDGIKFIDKSANKSFLNKSTRAVTKKINKVISKLN